MPGALDLVGAPVGQTAIDIEIFDLNRTDVNTIRVEPEGLFNANVDHVLRILGNEDDTVVLSSAYPAHPDGEWVIAVLDTSYTGDSATSGVFFDKYEYRDGGTPIATLYVERGVDVQYANDAPSIAGDLAIVAVKGAGVPITTADLVAVDPDSDPADLVFSVGHSAHGFVFNSQVGQLGNGDSFTQHDLDNGYISFVTDDPSYVGQGSFTVSLSDGNSGAPSSMTVGVTIVDAELRVLTTAGYDFEQDAPVAAIGAGVVQSSPTSTNFAIHNAAANRDFYFQGFNLVYDSNTDAFTAGTITFIEIAQHTTNTSLAILNLRVDAVDWMNAAYAAASGDQSLIEALTASWNFNFIGNVASDGFVGGAFNDIFTGRAGNDVLEGEFGYDRANYGGSAGPVNVQLADGVVTEYDAGMIVTGVDTLRSIELVTGSNFADTFSAGPSGSNPWGFGALSTNSGSTVTANVNGAFNEFEGRGGNDDITGNGQTRISYLHATAGVLVTFDASSWDPGNLAPGAAGTAVGDASVGEDNFVGVNSVRGSNFDDTFYGRDNPTQTAENFEGMGGDDWIDGGGGFDRAIYFLAADDTGITVDLAGGLVIGGAHTGTDTLRSVEAVWGTDFADSFNAIGFGASSANEGSFGGFNEFEGGGGDDQIIGNGNTRVSYTHATGGVVITLGASGSGGAVGNESVGHDSFFGINITVAHARGSEFNDVITGNGAANTLEGQGGNDVLRGLGASDTLTGGTGADIFVYDRLGGNGGIDTVTDFKGHLSEGDRIDLRAQTGLTSFSQLTSITAQVGADTVITFNSDPNTKLVLQGVTAATLTASDFILAHAPISPFPPASVAVPTISVSVQTPDGYDFSTLYDDLAVGYADLAAGTHASSNTTTQMFLVDAAKGITFEFIGTGFTYDPTTYVPTAGTITEINILDTTDPTQTTQDHVLVNTNGWSISASALFTDIAQYASTSTFSHLSGLGFLNAIFNGPAYSIVGSDGGDVFFGGDREDMFVGLSGSDTVDYSHATTGLMANLSTPGSNTGAAQGDIYMSIENLRGSTSNDTLIGDGSNNVLEGGLGSDTLDGGGGNNTVSYEHATLGAGNAGVTVKLNIQGGTTSQDTVQAGTDTLMNIQNVRGSAGHDTLTGSSGDNVFFGLGGNDIFVFKAFASGSGHDTIGDFTPGSDKIELDYPAFNPSGPNDFSHWIATHATQQGNGDLLIDLNVDGFEPNVDTILLKNVTLASLHSNDFILGNILVA